MRSLASRCWLVALTLLVAAPLALSARPQQSGGATTVPRPTQTPGATPFAARIASLSEPEGYFDTDNLISNEGSYLHVYDALGDPSLRGGAYVGVGPDQNFSYIARVRPAVAFIIDIRRDNLLLHLLFKALFDLAGTRADYLALLTGRTTPAPAPLRTASLDAIVHAIDVAVADDEGALKVLRTRIEARLTAFGVPLSPADLATIDRFHRQFIGAGLSLRFASIGRAPQAYYPTYRDLLLETDRAGVQRSFVATDDDFQFVKQLEGHDGVVPVVGDLAGPAAVRAIGRALDAAHTPLSVFYTSNVEFYLFREGTFPQFAANLATLPHGPKAVIVRSVFDGLVMREPGYGSAQLTQPVQTFLDGTARGLFRSYGQLVNGVR